MAEKNRPRSNLGSGGSPAGGSPFRGAPPDFASLPGALAKEGGEPGEWNPQRPRARAEARAAAKAQGAAERAAGKRTLEGFLSDLGARGDRRKGGVPPMLDEYPRALDVLRRFGFDPTPFQPADLAAASAWIAGRTLAREEEKSSSEDSSEESSSSEEPERGKRTGAQSYEGVVLSLPARLHPAGSVADLGVTGDRWEALRELASSGKEANGGPPAAAAPAGTLIGEKPSLREALRLIGALALPKRKRENRPALPSKAYFMPDQPARAAAGFAARVVESEMEKSAGGSSEES